MKYTILTGVVTLLAAAPAAMAQTPAKQSGTVSWQYYSGNTPIGDSVQPVGTKANIRCSVISSDGDGDWVCLYVEAVSKSKLPEDKRADACRPVGKDGKQFKLTNPALLPDSDMMQVVTFASGNVETTFKLVVTKDGSISLDMIRTYFTGDTNMSGAASVCWYVSKKK